MKTIDVFTLIQKVKKLEQQKQSKVEEILAQSRERAFIGEEIRNNTVLALTKELREIEDQLEHMVIL